MHSDLETATETKQAAPALTESFIPIDLEREPAYESGAKVLTALCFSEEVDDDDVRGRVHSSLCAWAIRERAQRDPDWNWPPQPIRPLYAAWPEKVVNTDVRRINTREKHRRIAAGIILPLLKQAELPEAEDVLKSLGRLSINKLAAELADAAKMEGVDNIKHRAWVPSRNILHLAAAFEFTRHIFQRFAHEQPKHQDYLWNPELLTLVLDRAQAFEPLVPIAAQKHRFRFDPADMVRLRIVNRVQKNSVQWTRFRRRPHETQGREAGSIALIGHLVKLQKRGRYDQKSRER